MGPEGGFARRASGRPSPVVPFPKPCWVSGFIPGSGACEYDGRTRGLGKWGGRDVKKAPGEKSAGKRPAFPYKVAMVLLVRTIFFVEDRFLGAAGPLHCAGPGASWIGPHP